MKTKLVGFSLIVLIAKGSRADNWHNSRQLLK
jgi:hypothetical protein